VFWRERARSVEGQLRRVIALQNEEMEAERAEFAQLAAQLAAACRLMDAMKAAATGADHPLEVRFRRALADAEKGDVVDH
jgi:hypothetical protein